MLANLDILEEYPKLYTRREEEIDLHCDNEGTSRVVQAVAYFLSNFQPTLLERPHLDCYQSEGTHNLPYIARYIRDKEYDHRTEVKVYA